MRRKLVTHKPTAAAVPATRIAWWAAFLTTLVLIVGLSVVRSSKAAVLPPIGAVNLPGVIEADEEEDEGDEAEDEAEVCEVAEEEDEEGTEEEAEDCESDELDVAPPACFLSSADAAVSADLDHEKLRLAVRYEGYEPATVAVDSSLRGNRGGLNLKGDQARFGRSGVFHLTESLTEAQTKRVAAAKSFTVTVRPVNARTRATPSSTRTSRSGGRPPAARCSSTPNRPSAAPAVASETAGALSRDPASRPASRRRRRDARDRSGDRSRIRGTPAAGRPLRPARGRDGQTRSRSRGRGYRAR